MKFRMLGVLPLAAVALAIGATPTLAGKANDTLIWATDREQDTVDPYYNNMRELVIIGRSVCDNLLFRNTKTYEYEPLLAKSYKWIDDVTMDFVLREDVYFHNGKKFKAEDVAYTVNFVVDPDNGVVVKNNVGWMKSAEVLSEYKVRIHLKKPFPAALEFISGPVPMLPKDHYANAPERPGKEGKIKRDYGALVPVCTGPYKITKMVPGESVMMERNEKYFKGGPKGTPAIKNLKFRTINDPETQIAELLTGGVDWIWDVNKDKAEDLTKMGGVQVVQAPTMRISYLAMDAVGKGGKNPFQDVRVRRAMNHAVNKEALAKNLVGGVSYAIHSACYPTQFGCTQDVAKYDYDPAKAKKLLAEAGYADGFTIDYYGYRQREYSEAVIGYLKAVGIKTNLKWLQYRALRSKTWDGSAQLVHLTWGSYSINDMSAITSHFFKHGKDDYSHDPDVKKWLEAGDASTDPAVRKDAYKKALGIIADKAYWVPLFPYAKFYVFSEEVNFSPTPDEIPRFFYAKWN